MELHTFRSSHRSCSIKNAVLKNFAKFEGKDLCWSLRPATLFKKRLQHRYFPVNIAKILRTPTLKNICERLFMYFRMLRKKNYFFWKNINMANRKIEKVGNLRNLGNIIPSFLFSEFLILPYSQNRKL